MGSVPSKLPVEGADLPGVITSDDVLEKLPLCGDLVIVGGGVIGCEMAGIYEAAGTKVTILEAMDRLLPNMESELGRSLALTFKKRGIEVHAKTFLKKIEQKGERLCVSYEEKGALIEKECDLVLLAAGRKAVTDVFEGEAPFMERGRFVINESCMTSIEDLYAVGDCAGSYPQLAHTAMAMAANAVSAICGKAAERNMNLIPSGVYTSPEIAACGLTEKEAQEKGLEAFSAKANTMANARSLIASGERGFMKLTVEKGSGKLLGAFMMCERATDLIHEAALAVHQEMTVNEVLNMIHGHPTFSEVFVSALEAAQKKLG
jgi:dihydrolipoamide dehydrogenase